MAQSNIIQPHIQHGCTSPIASIPTCCRNQSARLCTSLIRGAGVKVCRMEWASLSSASSASRGSMAAGASVPLNSSAIQSSRIMRPLHCGPPCATPESMAMLSSMSTASVAPLPVSLASETLSSCARGGFSGLTTYAHRAPAGDLNSIVISSGCGSAPSSTVKSQDDNSRCRAVYAGNMRV